METTRDINTVLQKLKKLQKLYDGAKAINSEAEAQNAAAKIQNLLTQYNLSMSDVYNTEDEDTSKNAVTEDHVGDEWFRKIGGAWDSALLYNICKYNFCYVLISSFHRSRINRNGRLVCELRKQYRIIGRPENIAVCKWLFDVLVRNFVRLSKERYAEYMADDSQAMMRLFTGEKRMSLDRFQRSYLFGVAKGVGEKLHEEREREKQAQVQVNALVLRNDAAVQNYVAEKYPKLGQARPAHIGSYKAMQTGQEDGRNANISRGGITNSSVNPNQIE